MRRPSPALGRSATGKKKQNNEKLKMLPPYKTLTFSLLSAKVKSLLPPAHCQTTSSCLSAGHGFNRSIPTIFNNIPRELSSLMTKFSLKVESF